MQVSSLPFRIDDVYGGFGEVEGILTLEKEGLKLEFQTRDNLLGVLKSDVKEIVLGLNQIDEMGFKKGLFGNKLTIRVKGMKLLEAIPHQNMAEICLSIKRRHVETALSIVSRAKLEVADQKYRKAFQEAL